MGLDSSMNMSNFLHPGFRSDSRIRGTQTLRKALSDLPFPPKLSFLEEPDGAKWPGSRNRNRGVVVIRLRIVAFDRLNQKKVTQTRKCFGLHIQYLVVYDLKWDSNILLSKQIQLLSTPASSGSIKRPPLWPSTKKIKPSN